MLLSPRSCAFAAPHLMIHLFYLLNQRSYHPLGLWVSYFRILMGHLFWSLTGAYTLPLSFPPTTSAYFPDGAHADADELEPGIAPPGSSSTCADSMTCPAPMYYIEKEYKGTYSNNADLQDVTTGEDNFGLDDYEPLFFYPLVSSLHWHALHFPYASRPALTNLIWCTHCDLPLAGWHNSQNGLTMEHSVYSSSLTRVPTKK